MKKAAPVLLTIVLLILLVLILRPRWYLNLTKQVDVSPETGAALVEKYDCRSCHVIGGQGALKAPNLDEAANRQGEDALYGWLANPRRMKANTAMPNFHLSDSEIHSILLYLQSLPVE